MCDGTTDCGDQSDEADCAGMLTICYTCIPPTPINCTLIYRDVLNFYTFLPIKYNLSGELEYYCSETNLSYL